MKTKAGLGPAQKRGRRFEGGFSVFELLIAMLLTAIILVAALNVFDFMGRVGRVQTQVAGMQQAIRVAQYDVVRMTRMAGRGGLVRGTMPAGIALAVRNNIDSAAAEIAVDTPSSPKAAPETDVLIVRGVFTSPIYQVNPTSPTSLILNADPPTEGETRILATTPAGVPLDLKPLKDASDTEEAVLLISPLGQYAVVELKPGESSFVEASGQITEATLKFKITGGTYTDEYLTLTPGGAFPNMETVSFVAVLAEYRFYVRDDPNLPMLSRARVYPGTDTAYRADLDNLQEDIAENILDLQVALGIDKDQNGNLGADEWLYDASSDDATAAEWNGPLPPPLLSARISTIARTERADRSYVSAPLVSLEDRVYNEPDDPTNLQEQEARLFRRRVLQTTVDIRNL